MLKTLSSLVIALMLGWSGAASAGDFQRGLKAYEAGDYGAALGEWRDLANEGHAGAQSFLGSMYLAGRGVTRDYAEAEKWFWLAAEQGDALAQFGLGQMYRKGAGVAQDHAEAANWYELAAEKGLAKAQRRLGNLYLKGQGVTKDYAQAAKWYVLAAEQGDAGAQINLGEMYGNGQGVIQDFVFAHMWFNIAAASGIEKAVRGRDAVAKKLTLTQITEAQNMAREWMEKHQAQ